MAASGDVRAGGAFVELYSKDAELRKGLDAATGRVRALGQGIAVAGAGLIGLGGLVLGPLIGASKVFADMGSELYDMSARTGIAVEALSSFRFAAEQSGASLAEVSIAIRKMQQTLAKADDDGKAATQTLANLGIELDSIQGLSPDEQFRKIAAAISAIPDESKKSAAAIAVFGKAGTQLKGMLADLGALEKKAKELGIVMSTEDASAADALGDSLAAMGDQLKFVTFQLGAVLAPALTEIIDATGPLLKDLIDWIKANRPLIVTVAKVAAVVSAVGVGLVVLGGAVSAAGAVIGLLSSAIGVVGSVLVAVVSPIGLVVVALTAVGVGLVALFAPGETLAAKFAWVWDQIVQGALWLLDTTILVVAGAVVAFQNWQTSIGILRDIVQLKFIGMTEDMKILWENLKGFAAWVGTSLVAAFTTAFTNISQVMFNFGGSFGRFWAAVVAKMKDPLSEFKFDFGKEMAGLGAGIKPIELPPIEIKGREKTALELQLEKQIEAAAAPLGEEAAALAKKIKEALFGAFGAAPGAAPKKPLPTAEEAKGKVEVVGTFSGAAAAAGGLGAKSINQRQLDALLAIAAAVDKARVEAEKTRKILELIDLGVI